MGTNSEYGEVISARPAKISQCSFLKRIFPDINDGSMMTDALKKWAWAQSGKVGPDEIYSFTEPISPVAARFWIKMFCQEVEKRAAGDGLYRHAHDKECENECIGAAFDEFSRELLGDKGETK